MGNLKSRLHLSKKGERPPSGDSGSSKITSSNPARSEVDQRASSAPKPVRATEPNPTDSGRASAATGRDAADTPTTATTARGRP